MPRKRKTLSEVVEKAASVPRSWKLRPEILTNYPIPVPLHGLAPRTILGSSWWDKVRREAYESTDFHCIVCGISKYEAQYRQWLEGHEYYEVDFLLGKMYYVETVPVCHLCHSFIHPGRLRWLLETRRITHAKYAAVIQHGERLLEKYRLERKDYRGPSVKWGEWRLVLFDKEYPPIFSSFDDYRHKYKEPDPEPEGE